MLQPAGAETTSSSTSAPLLRVMGTLGLAAAIVNITVGGGIFRLPSSVAGSLGAAAPIAYLVCAVAMGLIVLCIADAGSRVSLTGGPYAYIGVALGPYAGFLSGVLLLMLGVFATSAVATVFAGSVGLLVPALGGRAMNVLVLVATFVFWALVNMRGVALGARLNSVATVAKLLPLVLIAVGGLFFIDGANLQIASWPSATDVARTSLLLVFAFAGVEVALVPSGEVRDTARTVPRAIALAMVGITALYISLQVSAQGILGPGLAAATTSPLADAAGLAFGGWARVLLLTGAAISMFGYLGGMILSMPRMIFAMAHDGFLPGALGRVHPEYRTPVLAIALQTIVVIALAISGTFEPLAILANVSALALYFGCAVAAWRLRANAIEGRASGAGAIVPLLACGVIAWLLTGLAANEWLAFIACLAMGSLVYVMTARRRAMTRVPTGLVLVLTAGLGACTASTPSEPPLSTAAATDVAAICGDRRPAPLDPASYGMQLDGTFRHPFLTPLDEEHPHPFPGRLDQYDLGSYISNMKVEAVYEGAAFTPDPFHTWQNIVDFDGRRYLFQYDRSDGRVYDITDVTRVTVVESLGRGDVNAPEGTNAETLAGKDWDAHDFWGASSIQWNARLGKYIMIQSFEQKRQVSELGDDAERSKFVNPAGVAALRAGVQLKGFKVFELNGPRKKDWRLLAAVSTDASQKDPLRTEFNRLPQQGSGSLDVPFYVGGKYLFIATALDDTWANTEYPTYLYSAGYQAWDVSDPSNPTLLGSWHRPGQVRGEEGAYRTNPRCGNRTSWMGARMPLFIPTPVEQGGTVGFAAMGGFGLSVLDISNPSRMKEIGHLDLPPSVAGTEGDNIDVSDYARTGHIYISGYPLTEDCYEPYKDIYQIDVRDLAHPRLVGALPRPKPPANASFTDFCQRRGSFGPKRTGYYTSPGQPRNGLLVYGFYNAGIQIFDVSRPASPTIAAYFVPKAYGKETPDYAYGNQTHGAYVEWDRNIIWAFTNHGIYALSAPTLLGAPNLGAPKEPFRNSGL